MPLGGMAIAGGIGAVGQLAGGLISANAQKEAQQKALAYQKYQVAQAVADLERIGVPSEEAQKWVLQDPELVGLQTAEQLGPSQLQQVKADPSMIALQRNAAMQLAMRGDTGYTPEEKAQYNQTLRNAAMQQQAQQSQILQNMAERGMGGSGNELVARLQASQAGASAANQQAENFAANASQRALEAIGQSGNLAGQLRQQGFEEQSKAANAADAISEFNLRNRQNIGQQNASLQQQQANTVADTANRQEIANKGLIGTNYNQRLAKAQGIANARLGSASSIANTMGKVGEAQAKIGEGLGSFIGGAANSVGGYYQNQQNQSNFDRLAARLNPSNVSTGYIRSPYSIGTGDMSFS
jgi:hypothetical protein